MHTLLFDSFTRSCAGDLRDNGFFAFQGLRDPRVKHLFDVWRYYMFRYPGYQRIFSRARRTEVRKHVAMSDIGYRARKTSGTQGKVFSVYLKKNLLCDAGTCQLSPRQLTLPCKLHCDMEFKPNLWYFSFLEHNSRTCIFFTSVLESFLDNHQLMLFSDFLRRK